MRVTAKPEKYILARSPATSDLPKLKLVTIVEDEEVAKLLSDPMRRAILNILREKPINETQLAKRLGLTDATVNYHLSILSKSKLITIARKEVEEHGIMQKFYLPSSYLYLPDTDRLPVGVGRYYLPINIERVRGALSALKSAGGPLRELSGKQVDQVGEELAKILVGVARAYQDEEVNAGEGETRVNEIYSRAFEELLSAWRPRR